MTRVIKAGLASLPADDVIFDEEALLTARPVNTEEEISQLEDSDPRAADFRNSFRTSVSVLILHSHTNVYVRWFGRVPWSQVRKHELRQWLHWALFNSDMPPLDELPPRHSAALERAVQMIEKRIGRTIPEGSNPNIRPLRLSLDKLNVYSRPFIMYAIIYAINFLSMLRLKRKYHLQFSTFNGLEYAYLQSNIEIAHPPHRYCIRIPAAWDCNSDLRPIVFFHGLGLGISQYKLTLGRLVRNFSDRPILTILQPHVSQNIFHPNFLKPMTREQTTERLACLLDQLGWANLDNDVSEEMPAERASASKGVTMLSHSKCVYNLLGSPKG